MSMRHRRGLNKEQRVALRELDARASHDTGWFASRHDGGDVFALPHPDPGDAGGDIYLPPMGRRGRGLFAMRVRGSCMVPRINDGDTIIVDREQPPELGKIVVAVAGADWDLVLVKRLVEVDGRRWLQPLQGAAVPVDENVRIVGVVKQIISEA